MTKPDLSRRAFLELAACQSAAASVAASAVLAACRETEANTSALGLTGAAAKTLSLLIDEIVPAETGRPAASEVGTLAYFELLAPGDPSLAETIRAAIGTADSRSRSEGARGFAALPREKRSAVVHAFAESDPGVFARFRNYVYEGYYLDAQVWRVIGYQPYPTIGAGPTLAPFDSTLLDRVRGMTRRYRDA